MRFRHEVGAHFVQNDAHSGLSDLPGRLGPGQAAADDVNRLLVWRCAYDATTYGKNDQFSISQLPHATVICHRYADPEYEIPYLLSRIVQRL